MWPNCRFRVIQAKQVLAYAYLGPCRYVSGKDRHFRWHLIVLAWKFRWWKHAYKSVQVASTSKNSVNRSWHVPVHVNRLQDISVTCYSRSSSPLICNQSTSSPPPSAIDIMYSQGIHAYFLARGPKTSATAHRLESEMQKRIILRWLHWLYRLITPIIDLRGGFTIGTIQAKSKRVVRAAAHLLHHHSEHHPHCEFTHCVSKRMLMQNSPKKIHSILGS